MPAISRTRSTRPTVAPVIAVLVLSAALSGCGIFDPKPKFRADEPTAVLPQSFLYTPYEPMNDWLDTPVRIIVQDLPLDQVFSHPVFAGMNYRLHDMPTNNPAINFDGIGLTRRQLLWALAHEYGLQMTPIFRGPDSPAYIDIRAKPQSLGHVEKIEKR